MPFTLRRAGFFHLGAMHHEPLRGFTTTLDKLACSEDISDSLIVLPEAFNLGREYSPGGCVPGVTRTPPKLNARDILESLSGIVADRRCVLVVGVIDDNRRNSAFFIDGRRSRLMCYKMNSDETGEYEASSETGPDDNPITVGDVTIGTLICIDTQQQSIANVNKEQEPQGVSSQSSGKVQASAAVREGVIYEQAVSG